MRKITLIISLAWAISQLPSKDIKALKAGEVIKIKNHSIQIWAMPKKDIIIITKEGQNEQ